ncbi:MAG: hypothetical protein ACR2OZ_10525 [Verrucomicrobiales bacterium]
MKCHFSGRYRLPGDTKDTFVALGTTDRRVAESRMRRIFQEAQEAREGLTPPKAMRDAANALLAGYLHEYRGRA